MAAEFDDRLKQRLIAFQQHHELTADGVAGQTTWTMLAAATPTSAGQQTEQSQRTDAGSDPASTCSCAGGEQTGQSGEQPTDEEPPELAGVIYEDDSDGDGEEDHESDVTDDAVELQGRPRRPNRRQPRPRRRREAPPAPHDCRREAKACFSISQRRAWLLRPGRLVVAVVPALGGRPGHETPTGHFSVQYHDRDHVSRSYHNAPMPFYVNIGPLFGFHQGSLSVLSHGCIHLSRDNAERFFDYLHDGDPVDVVP